MKTSNLVKLTVVAGSLLAFSAQAGILGSKHDFSQYSWNNNPADPNTVCGVCHTPHHADPNSGPLWGHQSISTAGWTMYAQTVGAGSASSPGASVKYTPIPTAPNPSSLACLSCHDGSIAINAYGNPANNTLNASTFLSGSAAVSFDQGLNKNLSHSHPISFNYESVVGTGPGKDQFIYDQSAPVLVPTANSPGFTPGPDMSIKGFLLDSQGNVECSSCHDVHAQLGSPYDPVLNPNLVKINGTQAGVGSLLCRSCHNK